MHRPQSYERSGSQAYMSESTDGESSIFSCIVLAIWRKRVVLLHLPSQTTWLWNAFESLLCMKAGVITSKKRVHKFLYFFIFSRIDSKKRLLSVVMLVVCTLLIEQCGGNQVITTYLWPQSKIFSCLINRFVC